MEDKPLEAFQVALGLVNLVCVTRVDLRELSGSDFVSGELIPGNKAVNKVVSSTVNLLSVSLIVVLGY